MIVRIMGEGQVSLGEEQVEELNRLDDELMNLIDAGDDAGFRLTLGTLLDAVRSMGEPLPDDALEPSDAVLPASDATLEEVRGMLREDGLIPGTPTA
jgi:hypothetical protein